MVSHLEANAIGIVSPFAVKCRLTALTPVDDALAAYQAKFVVKGYKHIGANS